MESNRIGVYEFVKVVRDDLRRVKQDAAVEKEQLSMVKTVDLELKVPFSITLGGGTEFSIPSTDAKVD